MARKKQPERDLPPNSRRTGREGRISITITDPRTHQRLSHSKIKTDEPKTYGTVDEAWEGYERILLYLADGTDRGKTVREFRDEWTDAKHWRWGAARGSSSLKRLRSATNSFVLVYGDTQIDVIAERHIVEFMDNGGKPANLNALSTLFTDAIKANLRKTHPCDELARSSDKAQRKARRKRRKEIGVPTQEQVDTLLERAESPLFPDSIHGWLKVGVETGLRGGEIDAFEWKYLKRVVIDGELHGRYDVEWQWNDAEKDWTPPKHDSQRGVPIDPETMKVILEREGDHPRWVFVNSERNPWTHHTRDYWWRSTPSDGGLTLRQCVGGRTIYNATRHFWASRAVNVWGMSPAQASALYGHKDGGATIVEYYLDLDNDLAVEAARKARAAQPVDLNSERRKRRGA